MIVRPPVDEAELMARAVDLSGFTLGELAARRSLRVPTESRRAKGFAGQLVESLLGATAGSRAEPDFPGLGVELKTVPIDEHVRPREGTFVCTAPLDPVALGPWERSWVRRKLARVLWVPLVRAEVLADTLVGAPLLWSPDEDEQRAMRTDYDELLDLLASGEVARIDGRFGQVLQLRPKGADAGDLAWAVDVDGERVMDTARGFYLRPAFTGGVLARLLGG